MNAKSPRILKALGASIAAFALAVGLTGCATAEPEAKPTVTGAIKVIAATPVWASIAEAIGGDQVEATALISDPNQDPHSYEASARDQLAVESANLAIINGGHYDDFFAQMVETATADGSGPVIIHVANDLGVASADPHAGEADAHAGEEHSHAGEANEHFWYELGAVAEVAPIIAYELGQAKPSEQASFDANLKTFLADLALLEDDIAAGVEANFERPVFSSEPVADYLLAIFGLQNVTPAAFAEAIEEETDVPVAVLADSLNLIKQGKVDLLVVNAQTASPQVDQIVEAAKAAKVPLVEVTEYQIEPGQSFIAWMSDNVLKIKTALAGGDPASVEGN